MLRIKIFLSAIISFSCFSCSSIKQIEGTYCIVSRSVTPDNTTLAFKDDNTFNGTSWSDIAGRFSVFGMWSRSGDTLHLEIKQPRLIDTIIYAEKSNNPSFLNIQIIDAEKKKPIEGVYLFDGNKSYQTDNDGSVLISSIREDFLIIEYMGLKDSIRSKELSRNETKILFGFRNLQTFNLSHRWLIRKNKIIPAEKEFSVFRKCK